MMTAVGGDRDAVLVRLYECQHGSLVGLARLLLDDRGDAEEVVQEAFARVYDGWDRLRDKDDPLPYVRRTVTNLARGGLRRRLVARRARHVPIADVASPEAGALVDERRREVAAAVHRLPRRQRECVVLRYYVDCSTVETARTLGISDGSVKSHLHRALATLADMLEDES